MPLRPAAVASMTLSILKWRIASRKSERQWIEADDQGNQRCDVPAALSVQNGRSGTRGPQSGAANTASAFWPFKNERKASADHLRTPSLERTGPLPHFYDPPSYIGHQPPRGGNRTGSSALTRKEGLISMQSPPSVQSALPKMNSLQSFCRSVQREAIQL